MIGRRGRFMRSVPGGIRTPNLLIRSQLLYPVELQTLNGIVITRCRFANGNGRRAVHDPVLRSEQIEIVEHRDEFAAGDELFEIVAIAKRVVVQDVLPEGRSSRSR